MQKLEHYKFMFCVLTHSKSFSVEKCNEKNIKIITIRKKINKKLFISISFNISHQNHLIHIYNSSLKNPLIMFCIAK